MSVTNAPSILAGCMESDLLSDPGTLVGLDETGFTIQDERPKKVAWYRKLNTSVVVFNHSDHLAVQWHAMCSGHPITTIEIDTERDLDTSIYASRETAVIGAKLIGDSEDDNPERLSWFSIARESTVVTLSKPIDIRSLPYRKPTVFLSDRSLRDDDDEP